MDILRVSAIIVGMALLVGGCASGPQPGVAGAYRTWDDVINRWIGAKKDDLDYEFGPPNFHPKVLEDGTTEILWDMTIPKLGGNAQAYNLLPPYGYETNCQIMFLLNPDGVVKAGRRIGCD